MTMDPTRRLCAFCKREREREREQSGTKERCEIRCPKGEISKEQNQEVWFLKEGVFYCLMNISSFGFEVLVFVFSLFSGALILREEMMRGVDPCDRGFWL
jgi:hypothetical protein